MEGYPRRSYLKTNVSYWGTSYIHLGFCNLISLLYGDRGEAKCMIKRRCSSGLLVGCSKLHGVPIDRSSGASVIRQMIDIFNSRKFHLALAPEGTRKAVKGGNSDFIPLPKRPVFRSICYFDWGRKVIGYGERFELTDDPMADLREIQKSTRPWTLKATMTGASTLWMESNALKQLSWRLWQEEITT